MLAKCFAILANLFYNCYKCLRMLANGVANTTNVLGMKRECKTWVSYLHNTHVSLCLISPVQLAYFPSNLD